MMIELVLYSAYNLLIILFISIAVIGAKPAVGSSYNMVSGTSIKVLATPIRLLCTLDNLDYY